MDVTESELIKEEVQHYISQGVKACLARTPVGEHAPTFSQEAPSDCRKSCSLATLKHLQRLDSPVPRVLNLLHAPQTPLNHSKPDYVLC